jgi:hypothetical protein
MLPAVGLVAVVEAASYAYYQHAHDDDFVTIDISDSFHNIPDLFERRDTGSGEVLFSPYFPTKYYASDRNYRGKTMAVDKTGNIFRIFSFGGSPTAGSPWGHEASFSRFVEDGLNGIKRPATTVEVLNFGGGGYGSTRTLGLVKAAIDYQPDLVVVFEGSNELSDNWVYLDLAKDVVKGRFRWYTDQSYAVRLARLLLTREAKPPQRIDLLKSNAMFIPAPLKEKRGIKDVDRRYLAAQFKKNMAGVIGVARAKGVPVLFVSQPSNFFYEPSWYASAGDEVEAGLVEQLRQDVSDGNLDAARLGATRVLARNPENPVAHFYLGLADERVGDYRAAQTHLLDAIDLDENPERATRSYRSIEMDFQSENGGVFFADAWQAFIDALDDGLIDGRLVMDKVHPTVEGNKLVAVTILRDYFLKHRVRDDLFDYGRYDDLWIWDDNIDPGFYHVVCGRYFDLTDPARCVEEVQRRYETKTGQEKRIYRSAWEYFFYYGLLTRDPGWLEQSASIYRAQSLAPVVDAAPRWRAAHQ